MGLKVNINEDSQFGLDEFHPLSQPSIPFSSSSLSLYIMGVASAVAK
jgi:hypothetical protein